MAVCLALALAFAIFSIVVKRSWMGFVYDAIADNEDVAHITKGLAIVPEGRRIFPDLTVRENLMVGGHIVAEAVMLDGIEQVYAYFPQPVRCRAANNKCLPWVAP